MDDLDHEIDAELEAHLAWEVPEWTEWDDLNEREAKGFYDDVGAVA